MEAVRGQVPVLQELRPPVGSQPGRGVRWGHVVALCGAGCLWALLFSVGFFPQAADMEAPLEGQYTAPSWVLEVLVASE